MFSGDEKEEEEGVEAGGKWSVRKWEGALGSGERGR